MPAGDGINVPGKFDDYGHDPGGYWVKRSKSVKDGSYKYFDSLKRAAIRPDPP